MYISLYVVVNTFIGGRQPQNKLMRLRTFKNNRRGFGANDGIFLGMDLWSISPLYTTFRFDTCMEYLNIYRIHF